jgi:hypothetical protein
MVVSLLGAVLPKSPVYAQTQAPAPLDQIHYTDADSASWSSDGRYFVIQNAGLGFGFETDKPSWVEYDTLTGQITVNRRWPLQPALTDAQIQAFQFVDPATHDNYAFVSPNGRYIVYAAQPPNSWSASQWGLPNGIADLQTGQHLVTSLPTAALGLSDYLGGVRWSGDSSTFTVNTVTDYAGIYIYYVTNLNQSTFAPKLLTISDAVTPGPGFITGIPIGTNTIAVYGVYALSFDGQQILFQQATDAVYWNRTDPSENRSIHLPAGDYISSMGFDSQDNHQVFILGQRNIERYNLVTSQSAVIGSSLASTDSTDNPEYFVLGFPPMGKMWQL